MACKEEATESSPAPEHFFIGWDVGGWNCDKNPKSRDAIVILDASMNFVGQPWRGNLRTTICDEKTSHAWVSALFRLCKETAPNEVGSVTMAIDTPLGFSQEFRALVTGLSCVDTIGSSETNPYLYRFTERHLFEKGLRPLSALKDMIGSQATKGMHALAKFAPQVDSTGVWSDGAQFRAIETYPTACRGTEADVSKQDDFELLYHNDLRDALVCARIAALFSNRRHELESPPAEVPEGEGWIWVPKQGKH